MTVFSDPSLAATYDQRIPLRVPGYHLAAELTAAIIRDRFTSNAAIAIAGSGTGTEIKILAETEPGWRFTAIEPSEAMTGIAREKLPELARSGRISFITEKLEDAPPAEHDAVLAFLVGQFLPDDGQRLEFLKATAAQLRPGGVLFTYEAMDVGPDGAALGIWAMKQGVSETEAQATQNHVNQWHRLTPARAGRLLNQAGFENVTTYCQNLGFCGLVAQKTHRL